MLGLAPNKRGEFDDTDVQILNALGCELKLFFGYNLLVDGGVVTASSVYSSDTAPENILSEDMDTYWRPAASDRHPELVVDIPENQYFDKIVVRENIAHGQHIEEFDILGFDVKKNKWKKLAESTTVGYKRILSIKPGEYSKLKFRFREYRDFFEISGIAVN
jgi:alpha-L-fucosidase